MDQVLIMQQAPHRLINTTTLAFPTNGIGSLFKFSERIFLVFQRLHSKESYEGTGIGLAICKKIVENHNGYITATAKPGEGATFNIYIPVNVYTQSI